MDEGIAVEGDGPPLVEVTVRLWSLDPDTCDEEIEWRWRDRPAGTGSDAELFRLVEQVALRQVAHLERRPPRPS